jgi:hypothetical protein
LGPIVVIAVAIGSVIFRSIFAAGLLWTGSCLATMDSVGLVTSHSPGVRTVAAIFLPGAVLVIVGVERIISCPAYYSGPSAWVRQSLRTFSWEAWSFISRSSARAAVFGLVAGTAFYDIEGVWNWQPSMFGLAIFFGICMGVFAWVGGGLTSQIAQESREHLDILWSLEAFRAARIGSEQTPSPPAT